MPSALDMARILVGFGAADGGRVDPKNILRRPTGCDSRSAFMEAQDAGWLDGRGWVTAAGYEAIEEGADDD